MTTKLPILFSGIQPSGALGLGHYLGTMQHWLGLQDQHQCFFSVVDLHAITTLQDAVAIRSNSYDLIAWYLAAGIDPAKAVIFVQSHVRQHAELAWMLNCYTYMGELNRMTQFKDKSSQFSANINVALFSYPVLMAADILLYNTSKVPVGADQKQHLELVRNIAIRFNNKYGENNKHGDIFTVPEPVIAATGARIMSLQDPAKKMSKSDPNKNSTILLEDTPSLIASKIKKAVTDSVGLVAYDDNRAGIKNLIELYHLVSNKSIVDIVAMYEGKGYGAFKADLAEQVVGLLQPIQVRYKAYRADEQYLNEVISDGAKQAELVAETTVAKVTAAIGLIGK
jgi:tryptophanyl-tRNA synthetase